MTATRSTTAPRRPHTATAAAVVMLAVLAGLVWVLASGGSSTDQQTTSPLIDRPAPVTQGETVGGETFSLDDLRGQFVVVNFFATWCVPCQREHPELVEFSERHARTGDAGVVSVIFDEQTSQAVEFFRANGGDWPVVPDETGELAFAYGVAKVPESFIVAPDGTVVAKLIGGVTADGLDRVIEQHSGLR